MHRPDARYQYTPFGISGFVLLFRIRRYLWHQETRGACEQNCRPYLNAILATSSSIEVHQSGREYSNTSKISREDQLHEMIKLTCMIESFVKAASFYKARGRKQQPEAYDTT
jgi:hypothetical protein